MTEEIGAQAPDADVAQGTLGDVAPSVDTAIAGSPQGEFMTRQALADLQASISMADSWRATEQSRNDYPDDPDMARRRAGQLVFYFAAIRLGLTSKDVDPVDFMAAIRQEDFVAVMAGAAGK